MTDKKTNQAAQAAQAAQVPTVPVFCYGYRLTQPFEGDNEDGINREYINRWRRLQGGEVVIKSACDK